VVIAGHTAAVQAAVSKANEMGARMAVIIPVSVPCHCSLLKEAAEQFSEHLQTTAFKIPMLPIVSNVDLSVYHSVDEMRSLLKEQLYRPVRWVETIRLMKNNGIERFVECGPGKVLSGLVKRIDKSLVVLNVNDQASLDLALENIQ